MKCFASIINRKPLLYRSSQFSGSSWIISRLLRSLGVRGTHIVTPVIVMTPVLYLSFSLSLLSKICRVVLCSRYKNTLIYREGVNGGRSKEEEKDRTDIKRAKWGRSALRDDGVDAMDNILIGEEVGKNSS